MSRAAAERLDRLRPVATDPIGWARFASARPSGYGSRASDWAVAGAFVSDIFREIDEELRRDNLLKLWKQYGRHVIVAVVLVLAAAGGIAAWRDHLASERRAQSARYNNALGLVREGKDADAAKAFTAIANEGGGYGVLATFDQAELLAKSGDRKGAIEVYDRIAGSSSYDPELRDMAVLMSVMQSLPDGDPQALIKRLEPLTAAGNPFRATALELTAAARLKSGDKPGALQLYRNLADDLTAPQGLRARAAEMAAALAS